MKSNTLRFVLIALAVILILSGSYAFFFVKNNTSFLNFNNSKKTGIIRNNNSITSEPNTEASNMELQTLQVGDRFKSGAFSIERKLNLPKDFQISVYTAGLGAPRAMDFDDNNNLYISEKGSGKVVLYLNNKPDNKIVIEENLDNIHGIDFYKNDLYIAEEGMVSVYKNIKETGRFDKKEVLINNLPQGGHNTRTIHIGPDKKIYLTIGSSCNICEEKDKRRAAMMKYNLDGSGEEIFAEGLRNTVGFTFTNINGTNFDIVSVDNGRDRIGDNLPPEEVNLIRQGKHYGWPYCNGKGIPNPEYKTRESFCNTTEKPLYEMPAHIAPLGIEVFPVEKRNVDSKFPDELKNNLFITQHGSWNSTTPVGYKVVRINRSSGSPHEINFIAGFLEENGNAWGRPVDIKFDNNGNLFITDDKAGAVYKVSYKK